MGSPTSDDIVQSLADTIRALNSDLADVVIDPDALLLDEGYLDSLSSTELLATIEDRYGTFIGADRLVGDLATLRALAEWITAQG